VEQAQQRGYSPHEVKVRILVRSSSELTHLSAAWQSGYLEVFVGGVEDSVAVYRAYHGIHPLFSCVSGVEHITHIFHCASQGGDWGPYTEFYKTNVQGTHNLLRHALKLRALKRFVHLSTVDVYGTERTTAECDEDVPIRLQRRAAYSQTKAWAEQLLIDMYHMYALPVTILRPAVVYGPRSFSWGLEEAKLLYRRRGILISGSQFQCGAVYVDDVVAAMFGVVTTGRTIGRIYNVANPNSPTWRVWYDTLADGLHCARVRCSVPLWLATLLAWFCETYAKLLRRAHRPLLTLFVLSLIARPQLYPITKAFVDFGWQPRVPFEKGMEYMITWLRESGAYLQEDE
jgi:nucleoside-diphosphate-sugar epimerase